MSVTDLPRAAVHRSVLRSARQKEPNTIVRLVSEIERDYQFQLGYLVIRSLIQSASVSIDIESADDRTARLCENLMEKWTQSLPHAARAFAYGRAAFEKTYRYDQSTGLLLLAGLDYLPPEYTELALDDEGRFAGIQLESGEQKVLLGAEHSWWFALDPTATEPHGRSRYVGAPQEIWRARRKLEEQERIWYSKFAIGHGVARAPEKSDLPPTYQDAPAGSDDMLDPMEAMRRELAAIESGGILILSSRCSPEGKFYYDYDETEGQRDSTPLEHRRQMLDVAALRSLGIPERAITQDSQTGSRAIAQVHLQVLYRTAEGILDQITASFDRYVVAKAVEANWSARNAPTHRTTYRPLGEVVASQERQLGSIGA